MKGGTLGETDVACLEAVKLAADCLFILEQYGDCLLLLEPLIHMDDITRDTTRNYKQLLAGSFSLIAGSVFSICHYYLVDDVVGLYCIAGQCYDITDNRPRAIRALLTSVRIDATLIEAVQYIANKGLLSEMSRSSPCNETWQSWSRRCYSNRSIGNRQSI